MKDQSKSNVTLRIPSCIELKTLTTDVKKPKVFQSASSMRERERVMIGFLRSISNMSFCIIVIGRYVADSVILYSKPPNNAILYSGT